MFALSQKVNKQLPYNKQTAEIVNKPSLFLAAKLLLAVIDLKFISVLL